MPTHKEYSRKLTQLDNTRKMTRTMKLVAANRLRKAFEAQKKAVEYGSRLSSMLQASWGGLSSPANPLLVERKDAGRVLLLVVTSDRGLCGGFNNNLCRKAGVWAGEQKAGGRQVHLSFFGRRGTLQFKNHPEVRKCFAGDSGRPAFQDVRRIAVDLQAAFLSGQYDEVYLAYNAFLSALSQTPTILRLLPFQPELLTEESVQNENDLLFEPTRPDVIQALLPKLVTLRLYTVLLSSAAGEHGARMTAMENSTTNADKLIEVFALRRNRARQAAITRELTEIVAGAEALS